MAARDVRSLARETGLTEEQAERLLALSQRKVSSTPPAAVRPEQNADIEQLIAGYGDRDGAVLRLLPGENRTAVVSAIVAAAGERGLSVSWQRADGYSPRTHICFVLHKKGDSRESGPPERLPAVPEQSTGQA